MSSENWSNALFATGRNLGAWSEQELTKERDDAQYRRQLSLERLRQGHAEKLQTNRQTFQSAQTLGSQIQESREAEAGREFQAEQGDLNRANALKVEGARVDREELRQNQRDRALVESHAQDQSAKLAQRGQDLRDQLSKIKLDPQMALQSEEVVSAAVNEITTELERLEDKERQVEFNKIRAFAKSGDPRYADMSVEEMMDEAGIPREHFKTTRKPDGEPQTVERPPPKPTQGDVVEKQTTSQNADRPSWLNERWGSLDEAVSAVEAARPAPSARQSKREVIDAPGVDRGPDWVPRSWSSRGADRG